MLWTQFCVVHLVANSTFINLWNCVVILVSFANSNANIICTSVTKVMVNLWQLKACFVSNSKPDLFRFLNVICDDLKEWRHPPHQLRITCCVSCHVIDDVRCHAIKDVSSHVSIHVIADVICQRGTRHQDAGKRPVMTRKRVYLWRNRFVTKHRRR